MICLQSNDGATIDCQLKTAMKFPVIAKLIQDERLEKSIRANCETEALLLNVISGAALRALLLAAERPDDYEFCSHNALELMVLPINGRSIACSSKTMEEIMALNMLQIKAKVHYSKVDDCDEDDEFRMRIYLKGESMGIKLKRRNHSRPSRPKEFRQLRIFCGLDNKKIECQLKTAKKLMGLRSFIAAKEEEPIDDAEPWDPVLYLHLDLIGSRALDAVLKCAARPSDYEQCSHNARLLENMSKNGQNIRVSQEVLDEILENDLFGVEGSLRFNSAAQRNFYDLSLLLGQEVPLGDSIDAQKPNSLTEIVEKFNLKTFHIRCRDGKDIELLRSTMEKFKKLANILHCREAASEPAETTISYKNIRSDVLTTLFEIGVRRADFNVPLEHAGLIFASIPSEGRRMLVKSNVLSELLRYRSFFTDCKIKYESTHFKAFYCVHLVWRGELGFENEPKAPLHGQSAVKNELQMDPEYFLFETQDEKFIEIPVREIEYFPKLETLVKHALKQRHTTEPVKLNFISLDALTALVRSAGSTSDDILVHESTLNEIYLLKRCGIFDFKGSMKFVQAEVRTTYHFSIIWHNRKKSADKQRMETKSNVFVALCKDGRLVRSHVNTAKKIKAIRELLSSPNSPISPNMPKHVFVNFLNAEALETLLECVERPTDYEEDKENAAYRLSIPETGRVVVVDLKTIFVLGECLANDSDLKLIVNETNCFKRYKLRILQKGEEEFDKSVDSYFDQFKLVTNDTLSSSSSTTSVNSESTAENLTITETIVADNASTKAIVPFNNHKQFRAKLASQLKRKQDTFPTALTKKSKTLLKTTKRVWCSKKTSSSLRISFKNAIAHGFDLSISNWNIKVRSRQAKRPATERRSAYLEKGINDGEQVQDLSIIRNECQIANARESVSSEPCGPSNILNGTFEIREPLFHANCKNNESVFALTVTAMKFTALKQLMQACIADSKREPFTPFEISFISSKVLNILLSLALRPEDFKDLQYLNRAKLKMLNKDGLNGAAAANAGRTIEVDYGTFEEIHELYEKGKLDMESNGKVYFQKSQRLQRYSVWISFKNEGNQLNALSN